MKDARVYLRHIVECLDHVADYVQGGRDAFIAPGLTQDATLRRLQTMAEATQRLSAEFKAANPDVPWRAIAGFRNVLVHDYLGIDLDEVWRTIEDDLPPLRARVEAMLLGEDEA